MVGVIIHIRVIIGTDIQHEHPQHFICIRFVVGRNRAQPVSNFYSFPRRQTIVENQCCPISLLGGENSLFSSKSNSHFPFAFRVSNVRRMTMYASRRPQLRYLTITRGGITLSGEPASTKSALSFRVNSNAPDRIKLPHVTSAQ